MIWMPSGRTWPYFTSTLETTLARWQRRLKDIKAAAGRPSSGAAARRGLHSSRN